MAPKQRGNPVQVQDDQPDTNKQEQARPANSPDSKYPSVGDKVTITTKMVLGADESAHKEALRLLRANDEVGLTQMELQGRLFMVEGETEALLLEGGLFTYRVRIQSGPHTGKAGIITRDFVKKK